MKNKKAHAWFAVKTQQEKGLKTEFMHKTTIIKNY